MKAIGIAVTALALGAALLPARAQPFKPPLAFGMSAETAQAALGEPLYYVGGAPGQELLAAQLRPGFLGSRLNGARVFLQFRNGRLTGWKWDHPHQTLF